LRLFSFCGYGPALAALALVVFGAIEYPPIFLINRQEFMNLFISKYLLPSAENVQKKKKNAIPQFIM